MFAQFAHYESVRLANEQSPPAMTNYILYGLHSKRAFSLSVSKIETSICEYVTKSTEIICGVVVVAVVVVVVVLVMWGYYRRKNDN